ncbi:MAG: biotin transporter BioY [Veillonella parvula]
MAVTAGLHGKLLGPTGGFIFSWPVAYTLLSVFKGPKKSFFSYAWRSLVITIPVVYLFGVAGFMIVTKTESLGGLACSHVPSLFLEIIAECLVASRASN